jgi:hypothetical protein
LGAPGAGKIEEFSLIGGGGFVKREEESGRRSKNLTQRRREHREDGEKKIQEVGVKPSTRAGVSGALDRDWGTR